MVARLYSADALSVLIFSTADGSIFVAGIDWKLASDLSFTRICNLPFPESSVCYEVLTNLSGEEDDSSIDEVLVAVSAFNFLTAFYLDKNNQ